MAQSAELSGENAARMRKGQFHAIRMTSPRITSSRITPSSEHTQYRELSGSPRSHPFCRGLGSISQEYRLPLRPLRPVILALMTLFVTNDVIYQVAGGGGACSAYARRKRRRQLRSISPGSANQLGLYGGNKSRRPARRGSYELVQTTRRLDCRCQWK